MTALHTFKSSLQAPENDSLSLLGVQSDLEREVLALLRRLDEESQVGALLMLRAVERRGEVARRSARRG